MPAFKIKHVTHYTYLGKVNDSANQIILFPVKDAYQEVLRHDLKITGDPALEIFTDIYGNRVGTFSYANPHSELSIVSMVAVNTRVKPLPEDHAVRKDYWQELDSIAEQIAFIDFLKEETFPGIEGLRDLVFALRNSEDSPFRLAAKLCRYVYDHFNYIPGITTVETTLETIWQIKSGVCQDFAHILLEMLRMLRIPARYVSGYICPNKNGMRGVGATHAWVEAYIPGYGWLGFDPTNNCVANEMHVRLAVGRNFSDCSPVKGVYKGHPEHRLEVAVTVSYGDSPAADRKPEVVIEKGQGERSDNSFRRHQQVMQEQQQQQ